MPVVKVTTKMLTDLYGEHQARGAAPASVRKIHATISSMMTQACRWGWRDSNPAEWAEPPPLDNDEPVAPTPAEVLALLEAARCSQRPEHADVIYLAASTGARRGEICAIRRSALDVSERALTIRRAIVKRESHKIERPTKNRRKRMIALDAESLRILTGRLRDLDAAAQAVGVAVGSDPYLFACDATGDDPWDPDTISQFFGRLRDRVGLSHVEFKGLRTFMDTYGQVLGFDRAQISMRAGHDPSVAGKHYTARVTDVDREIADAMAELLRPEPEPDDPPTDDHP